MTDALNKGRIIYSYDNTKTMSFHFILYNQRLSVNLWLAVLHPAPWLGGSV